ncbi:MAG: CoA ester lyase [Marinobacter sp.]|uniref:CoA ester lyase n=1 Tax=Marinobacter sp. TaxID=50741 RepID=UPI0034A06B4E
MTTLLPRCRSLLFVPAHIQRFVDSAHTRGADAIILDLEDSVPPHLKASARSQLTDAVNHLDSHGLTVGVRINRDMRNAVWDLEASVVRGVQIILVPKAMSASHLQLIDELITELETERGLPGGSIHLMALIETVTGLSQVNELAKSCTRLTGIALGGEDLSADGHFEPTPEILFQPCQQVVFAARAAGIQAFGFPGSITEYGDLDEFAASVNRGRAMGFDGALCIHPSQVDILNQTFQPNKQEISHAKRVIEAYETAIAEHRGAVVLDGRMVDLPVVTRARALLSVP